MRVRIDQTGHERAALAVDDRGTICTDRLGRPLAQGIYFVQVTAEDRSLTKKLVLLR